MIKFKNLLPQISSLRDRITKNGQISKYNGVSYDYIPDIFNKNLSLVYFYSMCGYNNPNSVIVFYSMNNFLALKDSIFWFMDGAFKVYPMIFLLFMIHEYIFLRSSIGIRFDEVEDEKIICKNI